MELDINKRFSEAPWVNNFPVTIGGLGGIGSNVAYLLAKHGVNATIYDFDMVELHNIGGQMFDRRDVGKNKVRAIIDKILFIDINLRWNTNRKFTQISKITSVAFGCFDNMKARISFYNAWKNLYLSSTQEFKNNNPFILVDGRQNAETLDIYVVTPETMERYESEGLFDDSEVEDLPCNFKSTTHTGFLTSGIMVSAYTNYLANFNTQENVRSIPFRIQFTISIMHYESTY